MVIEITQSFNKCLKLILALTFLFKSEVCFLRISVDFGVILSQIFHTKNIHTVLKNQNLSFYSYLILPSKKLSKSITN